MVANIIGLVVECMKLMLVLCGVLNYKFKKSISGVIVFVISCFSFIILDVANKELFFDVVYFATIVICALFVETKRKLLTFLISAISFLAICSLDDFIVLLLRVVFSVPYETMTENAISDLLTNCLSIFIIMALAMIMKHFYYKKNKSKQLLNNSSILYLIMFLIGVLASSLLISPIGNPVYKDSLKNQMILGISIGLFIILFVMIGVLLIYNNNSKKYYMQVADIKNKLLESQQNYYQMLQEKEKETRRFRHDISNHILCLDTLIKDGKYIDAEEYLENMRDSVSELKPKYQTGNMLVNAIINDIASRYNNVQLIWTGVVPENLKLSNMDLCTIFSNVLENAFQAADGCIEQGNVRVTAKSLSNSLMVSVENDFIEPVKESKGIFITKKEDKENHGFGTMNVRSCVHSNGGSIEYNYDDKIFSVEIVLPNVVK